MVIDTQFFPTAILLDTNSCPALWKTWRECRLKHIFGEGLAQITFLSWQAVVSSWKYQHPKVEHTAGSGKEQLVMVYSCVRNRTENNWN